MEESFCSRSRSVAATVCATRSAIVGTPSVLVPLPAWGSPPPARRRQVLPTTSVPDLVEVVLEPLLEGRDRPPVHPRRSLVVPHLPPGPPTSYPLTAHGFPSSGPPDTVLRLTSGLSSSMTLLPAMLVDETNKATRPAPSLPAPPRQAGGSALLRAGPTASPATVFALAHPALAGIPLAAPARGRPCPGWPSAVPCGRRRPGSRHLYAGHHLASNPGNRQAPSRGLDSPPVPMPPQPNNDASDGERPPPGNPGSGAFSATPSWSPPDTSRAPFPRSLTTTVFS